MLLLVLEQAGIGPVALLEKSHEVGGTWSVNTYPGKWSHERTLPLLLALWTDHYFRHHPPLHK